MLYGPSATYTNLDIVTGRVILNLPAQASFSSIIVKLEGESRTRLQGIRPGAYSDGQQGKPTTETEFHRLLYMTQTVFPTPELQRQIRSGSSYTLPPGQYEYPFQFKIPFNNVCWDTTNALSNVSIGGMRLEIARDVNRHVKRTLPPTLGGFPGLAEIKYFVKVTAARPKFFQENLRAPELIVLPLRFSVQIYSGIEPPRALLEAMAGGTSSSHQPSLVAPTAPYQAEPSPASPPYQGPNSHHAAPNTPQPPFDDAPPTYEEALSQDIGPIVGPRTNYNPPPSPTPPPMPQRPGTSRNGNSANALAGPSNSGRQPSVSQDSGVERQAGGPGGSSNGKEKMKF
ncbi:putative arrestin (or s-antigen) n-terminal domain protein [Phaeomoniella chlamydospora]|uniref:Putative arrestin (Or s-antigen) n-terminal domain protein n=1 Tax=Phaeomoniella chlamydospora TaxID=158046 RepID=A0A0G2EF58_PHACM|nr:putative arrestin (or s-antigen) n-terminal domain protein [Phaeomoniella chlamydospora]